MRLGRKPLAYQILLGDGRFSNGLINRNSVPDAIARMYRLLAAVFFENVTTWNCTISVSTRLLAWIHPSGFATL